jgi:hypothetical protein
MRERLRSQARPLAAGAPRAGHVRRMREDVYPPTDLDALLGALDAAVRALYLELAGDPDLA